MFSFNQLLLACHNPYMQTYNPNTRDTLAEQCKMIKAVVIPNRFDVGRLSCQVRNLLIIQILNLKS